MIVAEALYVSWSSTIRNICRLYIIEAAYKQERRRCGEQLSNN